MRHFFHLSLIVDGAASTTAHSIGLYSDHKAKIPIMLKVLSNSIILTGLSPMTVGKPLLLGAIMSLSSATTAAFVSTAGSWAMVGSSALSSSRRMPATINGMTPLVWTSSLSSSDRLDKVKTVTRNLSGAKMIVFDKDGTLGDDVASLKRWALHMTAKLNGVSANEEMVNEFHETIGWDAKNNAVVPSAPLAAGTWDEQVITLETLIRKYNLEGANARDWHSEIELHGNDLPLIPNLREMLQDCTDRGMIVAVCTSDVRESTDQALSSWGVTDLIKYSICADEVTTPKPSAEPLKVLCGKTVENIAPEECIIVGDTLSDTGMSRNANALFCVGVLTGSGTPEILTDTGADIVIPSVADIPALFTAIGRV